METLIKYGKVNRPALGISYISAAQARAMGVGKGVLVLDVPKGSAAAKAGLQGSYRTDGGDVVLGDVIVGINGDLVETDLDLFRAIDKYAPGDKVGVRVVRLTPRAQGELGETEARLTLELGESPATDGSLPLDNRWGVKS